MIEALKFKFKSKNPASKKNRIINLCIDTTTGLLIVSMFFFARYLRHLMPEPPAKAAIVATAPATLAVSNAAAPASSLAVAPAPAAQPAPAAPVAATSPVTASTASAPPVEIPSSSSTAANLAGWITAPKPADKPAVTSPVGQVPANTADTSLANSSAAGVSNPVGQPESANPGQPAPAKPAPVSMGDSLMAVLSPSARAETIQPEMPAARNVDQPLKVPAARQPLKILAPVHVAAPAPLTEEQKRLQTAQASFDYVLGMAAKNPDIYGFTSGDQILEAKLGDPIRVYTVAPADQKNYQPGQPLKPILKPTNEWLFPAMLDNQVRFMVPVDGTDGEYVAGTSSRSLAIVYGKILDRWPASQGFHPQLVVNVNVDNYFFTIPELPDANLTDTGEMFEFNPTLSPASVILASWQ